jgi:threonine dehydrogenase-like Zn-dependent dehydrogenase
LVDEADIFRASEDLPQRILARTRGNRVDAALICTTRAGAPAAFRHALAVVRDGGCIDMITNYPQGAAVPIDALDAEALTAVRAANVCGHPQDGAYLHIEVEGRRLALTGHRGTSSGHLRRAAHELRSQPAYASLITHVLSLNDAAAAVQKLSHSGERSLHGRDCIKAVIDLTSQRPEHRESTP